MPAPGTTSSATCLVHPSSAAVFAVDAARRWRRRRHGQRRRRRRARSRRSSRSPTSSTASQDQIGQLDEDYDAAQDRKDELDRGDRGPAGQGRRPAGRSSTCCRSRSPGIAVDKFTDAARDSALSPVFSDAAAYSDAAAARRARTACRIDNGSGDVDEASAIADRARQGQGRPRGQAAGGGRPRRRPAGQDRPGQRARGPVHQAVRRRRRPSSATSIQQEQERRPPKRSPRPRRSQAQQDAAAARPPRQRPTRPQRAPRRAAPRRRATRGGAATPARPTARRHAAVAVTTTPRPGRPSSHRPIPARRRRRRAPASRSARRRASSACRTGSPPSRPAWPSTAPASPSTPGASPASSLPHQSAPQYAVDPARQPQDQIQPGDLIFYHSPIGHVGIYIGGGSIDPRPAHRRRRQGRRGQLGQGRRHRPPGLTVRRCRMRATVAGRPGRIGDAGIDDRRSARWLAEHIDGAVAPFEFDAHRRRPLQPHVPGHRRRRARASCCAGRRSGTCWPPRTTWRASTGSSPRSARTDVPVPPALGLCTDEAVNGAPFYVMGYVDGVVLDSVDRAAAAARRAAPPGQRAPHRRARRPPRRRHRRGRPRRPRQARGLHRAPGEALDAPSGRAPRPASCRRSTRSPGCCASACPSQHGVVDRPRRLPLRQLPHRRRPRAGSPRCSTGSCAPSATRSPTSATSGVYWFDGNAANVRANDPTSGRRLPQLRRAARALRHAHRPRPLRHRLLRGVQLLAAGGHQRGRVRPLPARGDGPAGRRRHDEHGRRRRAARQPGPGGADGARVSRR